MPDLHIASSFPDKRQVKESATGWINANLVMKSVLQELDNDDRKEIVLRCDDLPQLRGTEEEFLAVFSGLLKMILAGRDMQGKLFLHIDCKPVEETTTTMASGLWFTIRFHANINSCSYRLLDYKQQMADIEMLLRKNNGSLAVAQTNTQGCIFILSLPGKPF